MIWHVSPFSVTECPTPFSYGKNMEQPAEIGEVPQSVHTDPGGQFSKLVNQESIINRVCCIHN